MLLVRGLPLDGARILVVSRNGAPRTITEHLAGFTLDLELHDTYLLSFERPGCIGKQLLFNTEVPAGQAPMDYRFPFQVTLETAGPGQLEYAGPVGYIHFDERNGDFGYSTDYRIAKDSSLAAKLDQARVQFRETATAPVRQPVQAAQQARPVRTGAYEQVAPMTSRVAPKVHVLESSPRPVQGGVGPGRTEVPGGEAPALASLVPERGQGWRSEVQVDPLRVTTILTRDADGSQVEYRRVVSYYGSITYFRNGRPCSEATYLRETGQ